jgi:hypothetical protein
MQNISNNSQNITRGYRHENKDNRSGFPIYHLSNKNYELNKLAGRKQLNTLKPYQTA